MSLQTRSRLTEFPTQQLFIYRGLTFLNPILGYQRQPWGDVRFFAYAMFFLP
ncbi:hypothetical protein [Scytonema millei]|uniref:Uncharacterized protein n=1 Tax=Scytonema millei VB511283 TaxID=1245923 RepID=A0A9X5I794_9CYAN|nr:hypothetical protein [Scytonema millei]NHC37529.1 hypothetical protein [Scytonema millei VB511283]